MSYAPEKALVDVEEIDLSTKSVPRSVDLIISSVDAAVQGLGNAFPNPVDPTDRASLLASAEWVKQAQRSLYEAAESLGVQHHQLLSAAHLATHRAPLPKRRARRR